MSNKKVKERHCYKNITGQKFNRLTVIKYLYTKNKRAYWLCKCACGNEIVVPTTALKSGNTKSCGCLHIEQTKINISKAIKKQTKYKSKAEKDIGKKYTSIKQRCNNPNCKAYKNYGGRGIIMCDEWANNFKTFYCWAIANGYKEGLTIDRINVNGNYEPNNCRWVSNLKQQNNKRNSHYIIYDNKKLTCSEWARELNIPVGTILYRISKGYETKEVLNTNYKKRENINE